jgi:pimeloyl-ACP methyl ester carboxylesterase
MSVSTLSRLDSLLDGFECVHGGEGPPLLYLHGMRSGQEQIAEALSLLTAQHRTICPTMPGFGSAEAVDWIRSVDDVSYRYLEWLDAADLDRVVLVGCSIGAWLALEMATKCPARFPAVILASPLGIRTGPPDVRFYPDLFSMSPDEVHQMLWADPEAGAMDPNALSDDDLVAYLRDREALATYGWDPYFHTPNLVHRLSRISAPTLIVRGAADSLVTADAVAALQDGILGSEVVTVEGAGHFVEIEQPVRFAELVTGFTAQVAEEDLAPPLGGRG